MYDALKNEFMKTPEQLPPDKLKQAQGLADVLTELRKFLYLFFSLAFAITFYIVASEYVSIIIQIIIMILCLMYGMFKVRDYIRGKI